MACLVLVALIALAFIDEDKPLDNTDTHEVSSASLLIVANSFGNCWWQTHPFLPFLLWHLFDSIAEHGTRHFMCMQLEEITEKIH